MKIITYKINFEFIFGGRTFYNILMFANIHSKLYGDLTVWTKNICNIIL